MEHYLGEKLKKLRESRGWTQADLAKRLNKAVSTASGYESDAHAIPLDVLASISSLFSISTDELLGLDAPEVLSLSGLTGAQKKTLIKLRNELLSPSQKGNDLSPQQGAILGCTTSPVIGSITLGDPLPDTDPEIALRIYYAQAGEELFAVARRFHVAPAQILAANQLEEELTSLPQAQRLLIPVT